MQVQFSLHKENSPIGNFNLQASQNIAFTRTPPYCQDSWEIQFLKFMRENIRMAMKQDSTTDYLKYSQHLV